MNDAAIRVPAHIATIADDICACGLGETWRLVTEILERARDRTLAAWIGESPTREFVAHYLGSARIGVLDHGSSALYSFLTPDGDAVLEWLREHGEGFSDSEPGCPPDYIGPDGTHY